MEKVTVFRAFTIVSGGLAIISLLAGLFVPAWIVFEMKLSTIGIKTGAMGDHRVPPPPPPAEDITSGKMGSTTDEQKPLHPRQDEVNSEAKKLSEPVNLGIEGLTITTSAYIGLWTVSSCIDTGMGENCRTMSMEKFATSLTHSNTALATKGFQVFFGHFEAIQILMILGLAFTIGGFGLLCLYHRHEATSNPLKTNSGIICSMLWGTASILIFAAVAAEGQQNTNMSHGINLMKSVNPASEHFDMNCHFPWSLLISSFGAFFSVIVHVSLSTWMCKYPTLAEKKTGDWHEFSNHHQGP